jgi:MFS family permease
MTATCALLGRRAGAIVFLAFAAAYFCSALVRAITATLAPVLTTEFGLAARDLGLLGGGYFLGFAAMQLPLGSWLDRYGPQRVILCFLSVAVLGCLAFSVAASFGWLLASRVLVGMGVSACLMAPLTGYRRWFDAPTQLRANSWMLMSGSLGMLASTLPVQWLMPLTGWRPLFWILAAMIGLCMAVIGWVVPRWHSAGDSRAALRYLSLKGAGTGPSAANARASGTEPVATTGEAGAVAPDLAANGAARKAGANSHYGDIWRSAYFRRMSPIAFFNYGGLVAIQTLWAGPWMIRVAGYTPLEAATGLFYINAAMLATFWSWGVVNPMLARRGWSAERLIALGVPFSLLVLACNIALGPAAGWPGWALFCMASSVMGLAQPAVGMAFRPELAGRALSGYNLVVFAGIFVVQWGLGLLIDGFAAAGWAVVASFQAALGVLLACNLAAYLYFLVNKSLPAVSGVDNPVS